MHIRMDWRNMSFDWNQARAFLAAAEEGSFSAAARAMGVAQPTVGRQVAALERALEVTLFERVGGGLALTAPGAALLEHVRGMGAAAARLSLAATGHATSVEGDVVITSGEAIAAYLLPPILLELRRDYPGIRVELVATLETRDLARREADIAIRNYRTQAPELIARRLPDRVGHLYASDAYLEEIGPIRGPEDLKRADVIGFNLSEEMITGMARHGVELEARQIRFACEDHLVQWQACAAGLGVAVMMADVGDHAEGISRIPGMPPFPFQMWLVCHRELRTNRRIRVVFDRLAEALSRVD